MPELSNRLRLVSSASLAVGIVLLGAGGGWYYSAHAVKPPRHGASLRMASVAATPVLLSTCEVPIVAHGTVRAKKQVSIVPEVTGKLTFVHPDLAQGRVITKGELLFEIEDTVYQERVRQVESEIARLELQDETLDRQFDDLALRIDTARKMLANAEAVYQSGLNIDTVREIENIAEHQLVLSAKDALDDLSNRRAMIPLSKRDVSAQLDAARSRLAQAQHDLENTRILCPFDARVESASAIESQVITAFFAIATLTDLSAFEIAIGIDPRDVQWLLPTAQPRALEKGEFANPAPVTVRYSVSGATYSWRGYVTRFERVDERTRTARLVVDVRREDLDGLEAGFAEGGAPRLELGLFCQVELPPEPLEDAIIVPRTAVQENSFVYVVESDATSGTTGVGRLALRRVTVLRTLGDDVLVSHRDAPEGHLCELTERDRVIVSPISRPVLGMPVRVREADTLHASLPSTWIMFAGH